MNIFRLFFAAAILSIFANSSSYAQNKSPFNLPAGIPVPFWVAQTDWQRPNLFTIDSMVAEYNFTRKKEEKQAKPLPGSHSGYEDESFSEDPYITAYIRWRNKMAPFIQPDGAIQYDPEYAKNELLKSIDNQQNTNKTSGLHKTTTAAAWTVLGPSQTYSAPSGNLENHQANIYCIAIAPSNPSVLYAGSETGTFFRSADKGLHWVSVSDSLSSAGSNSIAIDPTNENIVYTYDGNANVLLKTTNGGTTWSVLTSYTGGTGNALAINRNTARVFITGSTAVYYSDNGGTTWTAATGSTVTGTLYDMAINPTGTDTMYVVGSTSAGMVQMLRSVNAGTSFTDVTGSISTENTTGARLGVTAANTNYIYCINLGATAPKVFKSTNRGSTWSITVTSTVTGLTGSSATTGLGMSNGQGFYDLSIVVSPLNANDVIVGSTTTYKSTDGGLNFSPLGGYHGNFGLHPDLQQAVALGGDAYIATDGGVNYSSDFFTNVANWSVRNNGLRASDFWGFGQGWDEDIVVGGRYHNGNTAISESYGAGKSLSLGGGEDATGHVFHGRSSTAGFRDIGTLVLPASLTGNVQYGAPDVPNTIWPQDDYYGLYSSKLVVDPRYSNVFYTGNDSILWKSSNCGASYTALHNFGNGNKVWRFEIARSKPSVIYVCTNNGIYKSTDAGATWNTITLGVTYSSYNADIAVNPLNENEVYVCMANASAGNKVFKSLNGGSTWTNITGTTLSGKKVAFLQFQGGTKSGVYAVSNIRPSKVYYRDSTMSDWIDFSAGLPASLEAREGALLFYRDSKIRLAGNCSVWESPLYSKGAPVAQPMADKKYVGCARDTIYFYDYSMNDYAGATRTWSFPGSSWVSSTTSRTPKVLYPGAGSYSVSLTVTNSLAQTNTHTVDSMIIVSDDHCAPDTVAGTCLQLNGTSQTVNLGIAPINSNNFSISCWAQPKGLQSSFAQLVAHDLYPGSAGYGFGFGFIFNGYTPNLTLCYTDSTVNYSNSSSLICDSTKWNYIVLTYSPTGVIMYLNGIPDTVNNAAMPVIDLSQSPFIINFDDHPGQGSKYNGKIDEVKFYNYALSQNEVREKMHLIPNPATETGLLKYFQFNQYDIVSGNLYDVKANFNTFVPSANIVTSTAPVGTGRVLRNPAVNTGGLNSFSAADVNMYLPSSCTYPNGEVVAFHLLCNPDTKPDTRPAVPGYFIVNNYGTNATFTQPDSIQLKRLNITYPGYTAGNFKLFSRPTGAFGNTWGTELDSAAVLNYASHNSSLTWTSHNSVTALNSQFVIVSRDTAAHNNSIINQHPDQFIISELYPNPGREYCKIDIHNPGYPGTEAKLIITDIKGGEILKISERLNAGDNTIMLPLPDLAEGIYMVSIMIPGEATQVRKLMID